jgi:histidinol-phosphatase
MRSVEEDLKFALHLARVAGETTGAYVGTQAAKAKAKPKADGSLVTDVDLEVETTLLEVVKKRRPGDGFLGEEVGSVLRGERRWIVDGIDGTRAFVAGRAEWSTLIALEERGRITVGVVSAPALDRLWWGSTRSGAWTARLSAPARRRERLAVSHQRSLAEARIGVWPPAGAVPGVHRDAAARLEAASRSTRTLDDARGVVPTRPSWGSGFPNAGLLVAAGMLDAVALYGGGPWDHAALAVIVEEAGGRFTDLSGDARIDTRGAVFSNGHLHRDLVAVLRG